MMKNLLKSPRYILSGLSGLLFVVLLLSCAADDLPEDDVKPGTDPEEEYPTDGPVKVEVRDENGFLQLFRNGKPYYIKGGAYNNFLSKIPKYGGNSLRTYSVDENTQAVLDSAMELKLTVCLGIWINRETDGFNYDDPVAVQKQFDKIKEQVIKYKDHPAVLMWGIGNEVDSRYTNYKVWNAINEVAEMIHEVDPYHPTTTVLAGADPVDIKEIISRAPAIDILGVNSYSPIIHAQEKIAGAGWDKPYMITEWGPRGTWANPGATSWGGLIEQTSTEKAVVYRDVYQNHIIANAKKGCVGSYVFLWGYQTHGAVATWYGLFNRHGQPFEAVQSMQYGWKGTFPADRAPRIETKQDIQLNGKTVTDNITLYPGEACQAVVNAVDPEGEGLTYDWQIVREGIILGNKPESDATLPGIKGLFEDNTKRSARFVAPSEGEYRLYAFVYDKAGNVASAVIPFLVTDE